MDTYYFSHDYNARNDEKIKRLIRKHGLAGYGCFWAIIEELYMNANALQMDYEGIAFDLRADKTMVESIVNDFELFVFDGDKFGSLSVQNRLEQRAKKSNTARESAYKRWNKDANALQTHSEGNAIKESKGKEKKESKGNKKGSKKFEPDFDVLEIWMVEPLKIWWNYKVQKKSRYVEPGWQALIRAIEKDYKSESELMAAVEHSMSKNWQGLFKPDVKSEPSHPQSNYDNSIWNQE